MMKVSISILFFIAIYCGQVFCQTQIIDAKTKKPIPYVNIISKKGVVLDVTDINGFIFTKNINNEFDIKNIDIVEISHISYKNIKIKWQKFLKKKYLELSENTIKLNGVTVEANKSDKDYLILKGYFRSYQLDEHLPKAYMDGIVEYYIPLHQKHKRLKINLIENRTFRNPEVYNSKSITGDRTGPPYIEKKTVLYELSSYNIIDSTDCRCKILTQIDTVGLITYNTLPKNIRVDIDITSPERAYTRSFLKNTVKFINFSVSEYFSSKVSQWNRKSNLIARTEYRKQLCSHKKWQKIPLLVESFHEFYVLEKRYASKTEVKKKKLSAFFGYRETNYSTQYWKNLESYGIPNAPDYISDLLGKSLEVY